MHDVVAQVQTNARNHANKLAIVFHDQTMTYGQLNEQSRLIAAALAKRGARPEKVYPIRMERGPAYVAALLGVMRAGAAAAPLSTNYPQERVDLIARDCKSDLVVDDAFVRQALATASPLPDEPSRLPSSAALVIYTSGSTGRPKGIVHEHAELTAAVKRTMSSEGTYPRTADDAHLSITPFSFVAMVVDLLTPLCAGNTIHILSEDERRDPGYIVDYVRRHGITTMFASPQLLRRLPELPSCLHVVGVGGERLSNVAPCDVPVRNAYGMSEIAGTVFSRVLDRAYESTPLGKALPGVCAYLLDEDGNPVPDGVRGELYLAGPLARGYLNQPELTAQTFLKNPFAAKDGFPRLLRTGDVFIHDPEHGYVYVNRRDWMVKVNGQRVEPWRERSDRPFSAPPPKITVRLKTRCAFFS